MGEYRHMQLSRRLRTIIDMAAVPCGTAADIGTDHGFVPIALLTEHRAKRCIASDIRKGPLSRAEEHIRAAGLTDRCSFRLGAGLQVLQENEAELLIIAGMGGLVIRGILLDGQSRLQGVLQMILSPHTEVPEVRRTVSELGFLIADERVVSEEGKFYTVISAVPGRGNLTEEEALYGPVLLRERPETFLSQIRYQIRKEEEILKKIRLSGKADSMQAAAAHEEELSRLGRILGGDAESTGG